MASSLSINGKAADLITGAPTKMTLRQNKIGQIPPLMKMDNLQVNVGDFPNVGKYFMKFFFNPRLLLTQDFFS